MALQGKFDFNGIEVPSAYARIERVDLEQKRVATVHVLLYASAAKAQAEPPIPFHAVSHTIDYDFESSANLYTQAYTQLKLKPFHGFADC